MNECVSEQSKEGIVEERKGEQERSTEEPTGRHRSLVPIAFRRNYQVQFVNRSWREACGPPPCNLHHREKENMGRITIRK